MLLVLGVFTMVGAVDGFSTSPRNLSAAIAACSW
jgi:hypothetical protein